MLAQRDLTNVEFATNASKMRSQIWTFVIRYAQVVHTTAEQVISRRGKNEDVCKM